MRRPRTGGEAAAGWRLAVSAATVVTLATAAPQTVGAQELPAAARLRAGASAPLVSPLVVGGGEVILDATVGEDGSVTDVTPLRSTPAYTEVVTSAVQGWRFEPATTLVKGARVTTEGHVLVLAVYRPPQVYAWPAPGEPTQTVGEPSATLPKPGSLSVPASYPPNAVRDRTVLIELEMTAAAVVRELRVMGPSSPFDGAALETVRTWRFDWPTEPTGAETIYAYALVGFREPVTQP